MVKLVVQTHLFYAEILTKYKDGKLIYASVEPGSYSYSNKNAVNLDKVEELDDLSMFSNLKDPKPVPYSVAQMEISSVPVTSVSFVTKGGNHKDTNPEKEQVDMPQLFNCFTHYTMIKSIQIRIYWISCLAILKCI